MLGEFDGVYHGKTVLITGDTGFKGTWLSLWLLRLGARVVGYSLPPKTNPSIFELLQMDKYIEHFDGDVRDYESFRRVYHHCNPEFVFHLAAQPIVRASYRDPVETFSTNIMGTVHVLELARLNQCTRTVINVTSDKVYNNKEWDYAYRENDALGGKDPYSVSKACADLVGSAYQESFLNGLGLANVRSGNVFGGGDWASDRLIPDIVRSIKQKQTIAIRNPRSVRPWQYVLEPLSGYLHLAARLHNHPQNFSGNWNFGPYAENMISVDELTQRFVEYWGEDQAISIEKNFDDCTAFREAGLLRLDWTKASTKLGWRPKMTLMEGIQETIHWYQTSYDTGANLENSFGYIDRYVRLGYSNRFN